MIEMRNHPEPLVSVLTPSIVERADLLEECRRSVENQTFERWEHLVLVDGERRGCSWTMNELAGRARGEWLLPMADDDLLLPGALDSLLAVADGADVVYAPPLIWGLDVDPWWFFQAPPAIPSFALIRRELWFELGGYDETAVREEDRKLWTKALERGASFVRADANPTWVYRFHGGNKSMNAVASGRRERVAA